MAVPRCQHSPMFGHAASWQTVCRFSASIRLLELAVARAAGRRHLEPRRLARRGAAATSGPRIFSTFGSHRGSPASALAITTRGLRRSVAQVCDTASTHLSHDLRHASGSMPEPGRENDVYGRVSRPGRGGDCSAGAQNGVFGLDQLGRSASTAPGGPTRARRRPPPPHPPDRLLAGPARAAQARRAARWRRCSRAATGAVLSHRSAAALHGLRDWGYTKIEVTVPRRSARRHDGIEVHRSTTLTGRTSPSSTASRAPPSPAPSSTSPRSSPAASSSARSTRPRSSRCLDLRRDQRPARAQPHAPGAKRSAASSPSTTSAAPRRANENEEALAGDHAGRSGSRTRSATTGSSSDDGGPAIKAGLRLARAARDRRDRRRQVAQHAPSGSSETVSATSG